MANPTSNLNVIQADKFFVWDPASKSHVNLQSSIVGLAPATLSTLQALASAVGNDLRQRRRPFRSLSTQKLMPSPSVRHSFGI